MLHFIQLSRSTEILLQFLPDQKPQKIVGSCWGIIPLGVQILTGIALFKHLHIMSTFDFLIIIEVNFTSILSFDMCQLPVVGSTWIYTDSSLAQQLGNANP